jgi:hemoglobin
MDGPEVLPGIALRGMRSVQDKIGSDFDISSMPFRRHLKINMSLALYDQLGGRPALLHLLRHFYADVRQHRLLAPVFNRHIQDWPVHIEKIAGFWARVAGGPSDYAGPMPLKHMTLGLREEHFQAWLGLWTHHCRAWLAPSAAEALIGSALQIAARLRVVCGIQSGAGEAFGFAIQSDSSVAPERGGEVHS